MAAKNYYPPIDHGCYPPKPPTRPLQFKRGSARAFRINNPILLRGEPAFEWDTKKMKVGDGETRYNKLPYIGDHSKPKDGKSAYEIWIDAGNSGTIEEFLQSLVGPSGKSAYEIWLALGHEGTLQDFIDYLIGPQGKSAYEVWIDADHTGTVDDFFDYITGDSAYEVWLKAGHTGTVEDYFDWLKTTSWGDFI